MSDGGILRAAIAPLSRLWRGRSAAVVLGRKAGDADQEAELHYRDGLERVRRGDGDGALSAFDRAIASAPHFADAVVARAELLDAQGCGDAARGEYERARRLWSKMSPGAPDRRYLFRHRGHFAFEIDAYDRVRSNVRNKILPQLAYGNALLIRGRAREALQSYELALKVKPELPEITALKGEALLTLGRYEEAIQAFDAVLAAQPSDGETLNSRGIARMALGRTAEANDDWRRQLGLLPPTQSAARGCVALRQANYAIAFHEFEMAHVKEPANPYWLIYRLTAGRLAGLATGATAGPDGGSWPAALVAFHAGQIAEQALLERADSPCRRAEALFQAGVAALARDPAAVRRHWRAVVEGGAPAMIEYAAARNELARLGS